MMLNEEIIERKKQTLRQSLNNFFFFNFSEALKKHFSSVIPNLSGSRDQFSGRQFFHGPGRIVKGAWFGQQCEPPEGWCNL